MPPPETAFAAGVLGGAAVFGALSWSAVFGLTLLLLGGGWLLLHRKAAMVLTGSWLLGLAAAGFFSWSAGGGMALPARDVGGSARLRVTDSRITAVPGLAAPRLIRAEVMALRLTGESEWRSGQLSVFLRLPRDCGYLPVVGEVAEVNGVFDLPMAEGVVRNDDGALEPLPVAGSFAGFLAGRGVERVLQARSYRRIGESPGLLGRLCRVRDLLLDRALEGVDSPGGRTYAAALFFGVTGGINGETRTQFLRSGTIHLFSVSGMHVAVLAAVLLWMMRPLPFRWRYAVLPFLVLAYALTTGAAAPAMRAWTMIAIWCALRWGLLTTPPIRMLALTAGLLVLFNPGLVRDLGFQFSFLITALLLLFAERSRQWRELCSESCLWMPSGRARFPVRRRYARMLALPLALGACVVAFLGGAGLSLRAQGLLLPGSVAANLLLLPVLSLLSPVLIAKLFLGGLPGVDWLGGRLLEFGFGWLDAVTALIADGVSRLAAVRPMLWELALFYVALFCWVGAESRRWSRLGVVVLVLLLGSWCWRVAWQKPALYVVAGGFAEQPTIAVSEPAVKLAYLMDPGAVDGARLATDFLLRRGTAVIDAVLYSEPRVSVVKGSETVLALLPVQRLELPDSDRYSRHFESYFAERSERFPAVSREKNGRICRIQREKKETRLDYFNPGSKFKFTLLIEESDAGWQLRLLPEGAPEVRRLIPYGSVPEEWCYEFRY